MKDNHIIVGYGVVLTAVVFAITGCERQEMAFTPVGADVQATYVCANKGGVESLRAYGEESYPSLAKLRIVCKDGTKWIEAVSETHSDMIKELVDLRYDNGRLQAELRAAKRDAEICHSPSDNN